MHKDAIDRLLTDFPSTNYEEWKSAAEALLKGAPFEKKMLTPTPEGITLQPIYRREDLEALGFADTLPGAEGYLRGTRAEGYRGQPWEIAQEISAACPQVFNRELLHDLVHGQSAVNIVPDEATLACKTPMQTEAGEAGQGGLSLACAADMATALNDVLADGVSFHFQSGAAGVALAAFFENWLGKQHSAAAGGSSTAFDKSAIRGSLNIDPLGILAEAGALPALTTLDGLYDEAAALASWYAKNRPEFSAMGVNTLAYHNAGASAVQELALAVATGLAYLRALTQRGLSVDEAASQIRFTLSIGGNFFMELAKFRVARFTWSRIIKTLGGSAEAQKIRLHARSGLYNKTAFDPYVNMLRTTTEALGGVIGGADSISIGAFDEVLRDADTFSRRIARNTQIILQEECELTAVADPAGGSWFIESLSAELGAKVWEQFQAIEKQGGMLAALQSGTVQTEIATTAAAKEKDLAQRKSTLVGTNRYPNLAEKPLEAHQTDPIAFRLRRTEELLALRELGDGAACCAALEALSAIDLSGNSTSQADAFFRALVHASQTGADINILTNALSSRLYDRSTCGNCCDNGKCDANTDGATGVDASPAATTLRPVVPALANARMAHRFEAMRAASSAYCQKHGHGPRLYLVNWGALRRHKARADFTRDFFETGGFEVIASGGFTDASEAAVALKESAAKVAVLCGHDEDYAAHGAEAFAALRKACPDVKLILAGAPGELEQTLRQAGMDDAISIRSNNLAVNETYLQFLGAMEPR